MLGLIELMIRITWKILSTVFVISIFIALIKNGTGAIRDIRDCIVDAIILGTQKLKYWLFKKHKEMEREQ